MKITQDINIEPTRFKTELESIVDVNRKFIIHPHEIKKPYYGKIDTNEIEIKDTPNIYQKDSAIYIYGRLINNKVEWLILPNNFLYKLLIVLVGCGICFFLLLKSAVLYGILGLILIFVFVLIQYLSYRGHMNNFINLVNEINKNVA